MKLAKKFDPTYCLNKLCFRHLLECQDIEQNGEGAGQSLGLCLWLNLFLTIMLFVVM